MPDFVLARKSKKKVKLEAGLDTPSASLRATRPTPLSDLEPETPKSSDLSSETEEITPQTELAASGDDGVITIVSGLPRSGTSMMMQMLYAGGFPLLTDEKREADADNPRGYFEFDQAKSLRTDNSWLPEAEGKAVKIVAQLLPFLPLQLKYRIIFMERDIDEVLASQRKMLERQDRSGGNISNERLEKLFARQLQQIKKLLADRNIPVLYVAHQDALQHTAEIAARVKEFIGEDLDEQAMANIVDLNLYRQRQGKLILK